MSSLQLTYGAFTSLDGLEQVTELPGDLHLEFIPSLASVAGLRNVTHVGNFWIDDNSALGALSFPSLLSIAGSLRLMYNSAVTTLAGLDTLTAVGGSIYIDGNDNLPAAEVQAFLARLGR